MRFNIHHKCAGCGGHWTSVQDLKLQLVTRIEAARRVNVVPADVSPCCGNATYNLRTGEQLFLTVEEAAELRLKYSQEESK